MADRKHARGINEATWEIRELFTSSTTCNIKTTVLPVKSDSDVMFCLQSYHGLIIDILLVY